MYLTTVFLLHISVVDDFDWMWGSGSSLSRYAGPPRDTTLGTKDGHYLYIENSFTDQDNLKAWAISEKCV